LAGRATMFQPQDLPGRYGRVVRAVEHVLQAMQCAAVLGGGWAVWRHGFVGRITQDLDIVLPTDRIDEFLRLAAVSGFESLPQAAGTWPKVRHKDTGIQVDILPEGERPGTAAKPAPTTIPHPAQLGGQPGALHYISLPRLIELKLAAGRGRDEADVIELMRANMAEAEPIRQHLSGIHASYVTLFDQLLQKARDQQDQ